MKENSKAGLRTAIYIRVSTEEQAQEGFSIRAQTEKLKAYALLKNWEIYGIYTDEGISGKNIVDRPAINRMIDDINDDHVNNVLVFKVDRLTRSTKNLIELVDLFEEQNCAFNSLTESIDTDTPSGRMFLKIIGIFAEFERENLVSRVKLGNERKAKEGYTLANSNISYGYSRQNGDMIQEILPDEAKIVNEIFAMYVDENIPMNTIAKILNERKIPTKNNKTWSVTTIKRILTNPTHIGKVRYSIKDESRYFEVDGHHEPILSDEMFNLAQEKLRNMPNIAKTKHPKDENFFCGLLVCGRCGGKFTTHNYLDKKKTHRSSYRCIKNKYFLDDGMRCKSPEISHVKMEAAFVEYINRISDFSETDVDIDNDNAKRESELLEYIASCERKLANLMNRKRAVSEQYINEEIEFDDYKNLLSISNGKIEALDSEIQRAKAELLSVNDTPSVSQEDIILSLKENWDYLDNNEKMMFLQRFVKQIVITVEKENARSNIVRIESIEFNSLAEPVLDKSRKIGVRSALSKKSSVPTL